MAQIGGLQGDKDRAVNRNATAIDKILEQVGGLNLDEKQSEQLEKIRLQSSIAALTEKVETLSTGVAPASPAQQTTDEFLTIINEANLNPNDPEVVLLSQQYQGNRIGFAVALGRKAAGIPPQPVTATATMPSGMGEPPPETEVQLTEEYIKKATVALETNKGELYKQLKEQYRNLGVQVDHVTWDYKPEY